MAILTFYQADNTLDSVLTLYLCICAFVDLSCLRACGHLHAAQVNIARVGRGHKLARANQPIIWNVKFCTR